MSYRCIFDLALFLDRFRNIDLYQQGLYCLKFGVEYHSQRGKVAGKVRDHSKADFIDLTSAHSLIPSTVSEDSDFFTSGVFLIRFAEEETALREVVTFSLEVESEEVELQGETLLSCSLLYCDPDCDLDPPLLDKHIKASPSPLPFRPISQSSYRLSLSPSGFHEFLPVIFDENHRCVVHTSLHFFLTDFCMRDEDFGREQEDLPTKLAKALFVDKNRQPKLYIGGQEIDRTYRNYAGRLADSHEFLRGILIKIATPDLTLEESAIPDSLSLPILQPEGEKSTAKFSEAVWSHDPAQVATALIEEIAAISSQVLHMFYILIRILKLFPGQVIRPLADIHREREKDRLGNCLIRTIRRVRGVPIYANTGTDQQSAATEARSHFLPPLPIESTVAFGDFPVLFEETYIHIFPEEMTAAPSPQSVEECPPGSVFFPSPYLSLIGSGGQKHAFVLVHGFQGRSYDAIGMRFPASVHLLKQAIILTYTDSIVLSSASNEKSTDDDLGTMGERLAKETIAFLNEWCPGKRLGKLSFIGHSMGGLVIRAALPHLIEFADRMHLFLTLCTPHLGYMYNNSKLIDAGIWVLKKWKRSAALQQISMSDDSDVESTFLFNMSASAGMRWFQFVVLCSSQQDLYVPRDSARIEIARNSLMEEEKTRTYYRMANNLLSQIAVDRLYRIDVNFRLRGKGLDSFIGRTAHIQFLESEQFLEALVQLYPQFFTG